MPLSERYERALVWAARKHARQVRKGTTIPYVSHLLAVSSLALEHGADEDEAIAALLHDAVEDQGGPRTREEIRAEFGERVASIVDGCTDTDQDPKPPWRPRKEAYVAHIAEAPPSVLLVSACDKLHNARSILSDLRATGPAVWDRFTGKRDGTLWYYRALADAFAAAGAPKGLVADLARVVREMEAEAVSRRA